MTRPSPRLVLITVIILVITVMTAVVLSLRRRASQGLGDASPSIRLVQDDAPPSLEGASDVSMAPTNQATTTTLEYVEPLKKQAPERPQVALSLASASSVVLSEPIAQEVVSSTIPLRLNIDSDADGVSDRDETETYRTDPAKADTDGDSYPDGEEIEKGYNPLGPGRCVSATCIPSV